MSNLPLLDATVFAAIDAAELKIEEALDADVLFFNGEIRGWIITLFRNRIEALATQAKKRAALAIVLTTPGGEAEVVEKMVEIIRHHYSPVYFVVPATAFSAGTILCMSGDKIYMDYSSSLGPIDPQVPDKDGKYLVPALGYLDKVEELVKKSKDGAITPAELAILVRQDLAMLRFYEQAKDLSIALLKKWLTEYKFKDWTVHRTHKPGTPVKPEEKAERAQEIATKLSDNRTWHSHGRMIGINTLNSVLHLEIEDYGKDKELSKAIRTYSDTLCDYLNRAQQDFFIYNQRLGIT